MRGGDEPNNENKVKQDIQIKNLIGPVHPTEN